MFSGTVKFISLRSMAYRYKYEKQRIRSDNYLNLCLLKYTNAYVSHCFRNIIYPCGDHGSTVVKVAGSIPVGVSGFFIDIKSF